jgi:hypothetical protein
MADVAATDAYPVEAASTASTASTAGTKAGKDRKYVVDARGAAGLQVGGGNVQHDAFAA